MKPDKAGIWEWFDEDGTKRLMSVFDVAFALPGEPPYLRVYWWGGYYDVEFCTDPETLAQDPYYNDGMWPDRWGQWVGEIGSVPDDQLYEMPTPEQRKKIFENLD